MEKTLAMEPAGHEAAELQDAISRCLAEMSELRDRMRQEDAAIEESRVQTKHNLAEIGKALAELKAA